MTDTKLVLLRTHRDNFNRFNEVLATDLTPYERRYVEDRMLEERHAIRFLIKSEAAWRTWRGEIRAVAS